MKIIAGAFMGKKNSSEKVKKRKERWFNGPRKIKES